MKSTVKPDASTVVPRVPVRRSGFVYNNTSLKSKLVSLTSRLTFMKEENEEDVFDVLNDLIDSIRRVNKKGHNEKLLKRYMQKPGVSDTKKLRAKVFLALFRNIDDPISLKCELNEISTD